MIDLKTLEAVKGGPIKFDKRKFPDDVTVTLDANGNEVAEASEVKEDNSIDRIDRSSDDDKTLNN